jgi:hypothetical protein
MPGESPPPEIEPATAGSGVQWRGWAVPWPPRSAGADALAQAYAQQLASRPPRRPRPDHAGLVGDGDNASHDEQVQAWPARPRGDG